MEEGQVHPKCSAELSPLVALVPAVSLEEGPGVHARDGRAGPGGGSVYLPPPEGTRMQPKLPRCTQAPVRKLRPQAGEAVPARGLPGGVPVLSPQDAAQHLDLIFCPFLSQSGTNRNPESI